MHIRARIREVNDSVKIVFIRPWYILLAIFVSTGMVAIGSLLPNKNLISYFFTNDYFSWIARFKIVWNLFWTFGVNVTVTGKIISVIISLVAGISVALLVFFIKRRVRFSLAGGTSLLGIILSFVGVGCASCGSLLLTTAIGLSASTAFLGFLPLNGLEVGIISLALLVWSIFSVSKKIQNPLLCKLN